MTSKISKASGLYGIIFVIYLLLFLISYIYSSDIIIITLIPLCFLLTIYFVNYEINRIEKKSILYENILDLASDSVFVMDKNGEVIKFSQNAAKTLGYSIKEFEGKNLDLWRCKTFW